MSRVLGIVFLIVIMLLASVGSADAVRLPNKSSVANTNNATDEHTSLGGIAGPFQFSNELDEMVGDTVSVLTNWRDQQHNAGYTRLVAVDNSNPDNTVIHMTWTQHYAEAASPRYVVYYKMNVDGEGTITPGMDEVASIGAAGSGYSVIDLDYETGAIYVLMHQPATGGGYWTSLMTESEFVPGFFNSYNLPDPAGGDYIWPQFALTRYEGNLYAHVVSNGYEEAIETNVYYHRAMFDPTAGWGNATPGDVPNIVITTHSATLSTVPAVNSDGSIVAVASSVSRYLQGEGPPDWVDSRAAQSNNDIYVWTSTDGGVTWDWENYLNVTNFIPPNENLLPDTTAANKDTLRSYSEVDIIYDGDNTLHAAFNTLNLDFYRSGGAASLNGRMWHWDNESGLFSQIVDGDFWNFTQPAAWELTVCHANLYKDEDTGILWASWVQYGEPGDTLEDGRPFDASAAGFANSDIYVAASPDNGLRWTKGVNVTDTRSMEAELAPGASRSERDPSLAFNSDGDYLHLFYTLDFDAGISPIPGQEQGVATENRMVYHRVPKLELLDMFEENAEWVRNYPLHIDSTNMYIDPDDWVWNGFMPNSVRDNGTLRPDQFELTQNYPNPFNPSTKISFNLQSAGLVKLAVYDVLGREVATLVNRPMSAGSHHVSFLADDLPSGVYFYRLTSGDASQVRKMVLMK